MLGLPARSIDHGRGGEASLCGELHVYGGPGVLFCQCMVSIIEAGRKDAHSGETVNNLGHDPIVVGALREINEVVAGQQVYASAKCIADYLR